MKYLMVTSWDNHWDRVEYTYYTEYMLKEGMTKDNLQEGTQTIFIKINKTTKKIEKGWIGQVNNFKIEKDKIFFNLRIQKELSIDEIKNFSNKSEGWYLLVDDISSEKKHFLEQIFYPPCFYILYLTNDWTIFEDYTHYLLKLLGINDIYKFKKQRGLSDGFFKIEKLAVLYDCTLEKDFEGRKKNQISNYFAQLSREEIEVENKKISIKNCDKQVWIITKGQTRLIKEVDDIKFKEVSIYSLFDIYNLRITENLFEKELADKLRDIT